MVQTVRRETPLPWAQLLPLLAMRVCEPIIYSLVLPFEYKMIEGFNIAKSPKDIAFYASLLFSSFAVAQTMTIMYWSRLSDRIGRRPVLLMGMTGNLVTFLLFSVSTTFYMALGARSLNGLLAGNVAVIKSVLAEISDDTNRARIMALLPLVWNVGWVAGTAIGGIFADPAKMFPGIFGHFQPFIVFPYLLPCLIGASATALGLFIGMFVVKETLVREKECVVVGETTPLNRATPPQPKKQEQRTYKQLMTPTVTSVLLNNALISWVIMMSDQMYPIFAATSTDYGGLGFDSRSIGYSLAISGLAVFYVQLVVYPRLEHKYGALHCYRLGQLLLIPYLLLMPLLSSLAFRARTDAMGPELYCVLWMALMALLVLRVAGQVFVFTSINLLTVNLAPTRADLGFMNGAQQLAMSATRVLGPLSGGLAWSWSLKHALPYPLNAHFVWVLSAALTSYSLYLAQGIPDSVNVFAADANDQQ